jgi:hypothetical protein
MKKLLIIVLFVPFLFACKQKEGCMDQNSLNYDADAEKDDGSCEYRKVIFYLKNGSYGGVQITSVDVTVNGTNIGTATTVYSDGPGSCNAAGSAIYEFHNNESIDWNSVVHLSNGSNLYGSGTVTPTDSECMEVNVTY